MPVCTPTRFEHFVQARVTAIYNQYMMYIRLMLKRGADNNLVVYKIKRFGQTYNKYVHYVQQMQSSYLNWKSAV